VLNLSWKDTIGSIALAGLLSFGIAPQATHAMSKADTSQLTYLQVKGTGLANHCSDVEGEGSIKVSASGRHQIVDMCIEPKAFAVEEEIGSTKAGKVEKQFVNAKVMTR
jgi:photosystem II oxygen-evolving enhancer protein 1